MQKVNRLLYYRLRQYWDEDTLNEMFDDVRTCFSMYENGTRAEIEQEISRDDALLEEVLEQEEEDRNREGESSREVNHDACAVCQQEEAASRNALLVYAMCFRRFHRICHTPPILESVGESFAWFCNDCSSVDNRGSVN
jgi:hypothetical protein